jgi:hypothetical protein
MKLTDKTDKWSMGSRRYEGRKNGYKVAIIFLAKSWADENEYWFYTLSNDNYSYNCLWEKLLFTSYPTNFIW